MRCAALLVLMAATAAAQEATRETPKPLQTLLAQRVTLDVREAPIETVVDAMRDASGLAIRIDPDVREQRAPEDLRVTLCLKDQPVRTVLRAALGRKRLAAVWHGSAVVVVPKEKTFALRFYDVRDLSFTLRDFPGPTLGLREFEEPWGPCPCCCDPDSLVDLVKLVTGGRSWEEEPTGRIHLVNGLLVVSQTPGVHSEIADLVRRFRKAK